MSKTEKKVPTSLKECYESDTLSQTLWKWSDWLKIWGRRVFLLLIVVGAAFTLSDVIDPVGFYGSPFLVLIRNILGWGLYAFLEFCAYNILSFLLSALASVVENTKITANVALYNAAKKEGILGEEAFDAQETADEYSAV